MKKQKKTYADLAKAITAKYRKRLGENFERSDPMAEASMQRELDALAERQEMAKQAQAENQYREMCKGGKLPKMWSGSWIDSNPWEKPQNEFVTPVISQYYEPFVPRTEAQVYKDAFVSNAGKGNLTQAKQAGSLYGNTVAGYIPTIQFSAANTSKAPKNSWWSQIPTESKIGMGAQLAGVLGQGIIAATAGKPKNLEYHDITIPEPELIRNDEQIAAATRAYRGAQNNLRYLSPSQYMAGMSDLATREAAAKAGIIEGTANQNAEILNRSRWQQYAAQRDNAANRLSVDQYNEAMRQNYIGNIGQMVGNIAGVAAGTMKDESARKMQNSMMGFMSQANYGSVIGKNGYPIATKRVGNTETWEDIDGPHYRVNGQEVGLNEFIAAFEKHQKSLQTNTEKK